MRTSSARFIFPPLLLPLLCALQAPTVGAATVYLSPGESIQKAIHAAAAGDTIVLRDGVYHEVVDIDRSITLRAENPGEATVTNRHPGVVEWRESAAGSRIWSAKAIDWPVHWLLVDGVHAFDYRSREGFEKRECGPFWSKGWQEDKQTYLAPPLYFAHDAASQTLWLALDDDRDPNQCRIDFNSARLDGATLVQKDLGDYWNQQQIVVVSSNPPVHPITMWYGGTPENPEQPRVIDFPKICGVVINISADHVTLDGLRIHLAPTVGVGVNNSDHVTIRDCYFSGYQFAINTGYECTNLTVEHCEMDGGLLVSRGGHHDITLNMWCHSTYVNPIKFNGTGLAFRHNYVYEGFDLFQPRGRHKDFPHVPDLRSDVAYNVWQNAMDNALEFDGVEAQMNLRFHHNLVLGQHDTLAITTTENGGPLTIDHNLWWPGGNRIMKLVGTGRINRGVEFLHNTYFSGNVCSINAFEQSRFENNIVISCLDSPGCWSVDTLGGFFPNEFNLLQNGARYTIGFEGLVADPHLGNSPETRFTLKSASPAIDAGRIDLRGYQENVKDGRPDLGALEFGETVDDWRRRFGHCGPRWITAENAYMKAPHRPEWPAEIDLRWGGLDDCDEK